MPDDVFVSCNIMPVLCVLHLHFTLFGPLQYTDSDTTDTDILTINVTLKSFTILTTSNLSSPMPWSLVLAHYLRKVFLINKWVSHYLVPELLAYTYKVEGFIVLLLSTYIRKPYLNLIPHTIPNPPVAGRSL